MNVYQIVEIDIVIYAGLFVAARFRVGQRKGEGVFLNAHSAPSISFKGGTENIPSLLGCGDFLLYKDFDDPSPSLAQDIPIPSPLGQFVNETIIGTYAANMLDASTHRTDEIQAPRPFGGLMRLEHFQARIKLAQFIFESREDHGFIAALLRQ